VCLKRREPRPREPPVLFLPACTPARRPAEVWLARIREIIVSVVVVVCLLLFGVSMFSFGLNV
jgi:hypothetical protein